MSDEENFVGEDSTQDVNTQNFNSYDAPGGRLLQTQINEATQNTKRKSHAFWVVVGIVSVMFLAAVVFAFCALDATRDSEGKADWHLLVTVATLLIPPTIICVALIRGIYNDSRKNSKHLKLQDLPASEFITAIKDLTPSIKNFGGK